MEQRHSEKPQSRQRPGQAQLRRQGVIVNGAASTTQRPVVGLDETAAVKRVIGAGLAAGEFKIEHSVPIPARSRFPLADMAVGDSFLLRDKGQLPSVRATAWSYGRRHGLKFAIRKVPQGWRCWRVA